MDIETIKRSIEEEGLDYFILYYGSSDNMPTKELEEKFKKAENALIHFEKAIIEEAKNNKG